ncbi:ATP-binding protein [Candidatus Gottesmanbacteria bacterium]|nr:ATP-binding protein [Candidatus Gottesmanbacteria bacterium]
MTKTIYNEQPIEDGIVTISRAVGTITYPAKFVLIAASNPCPCGYLGDKVKNCCCLPGQISQYKKRISGPILDRIDLHIDLPPVTAEKLTGNFKSESSKGVRKRVQKARNLQSKRFAKTDFVCNSDMTARFIKEKIFLSPDCLNLLKQAVTAMRFSARTYYRIIKVGRTIADLSGEKEVLNVHIAEALQYRVRDEI